MDSAEEPLESRFIVSIEDISNVWAILKPVSPLSQQHCQS